MSTRRRVRRLTPGILRKIVMEERSRVMNESDPIVQGIEDPEKVSADEVDADEYAGSLEKDLDHLKALKISEARIVESLKKIRGKKASLIKKLSK